MQLSIQQMQMARLKESGYQPLAVASNGKNPLHKGWSTRDIPLDEVLSKDTDRYGIRCGDNGLTCIDIDSKNHSQPELMKTKFFDRIGSSMFNKKKIVHQKTLSAGAHIFYRAGTPKGSEVLSRNVSGETLVETRGIGGQAVMYELDKCLGIVDLPVLTPEEESVLLNAARSFNEYKVPIATLLNTTSLSLAETSCLSRGGQWWTRMNRGFACCAMATPRARLRQQSTRTLTGCGSFRRQQVCRLEPCLRQQISRFT